MTDMLNSIVPKSSQLNADDLIGDRSITIKITKVSGVSGEQPIAINYENDNGKPYMPCKGMRRVLVNAWGADGTKYVGRSLTLYRDEKVMFGGIAVGGIRISHMSDIKEPITMALTATRASRKPFTVKPLTDAPKPAEPPSDTLLDGIRERGNEAATKGTASLQEWWKNLAPEYQKKLAAEKEGWKKVAQEADKIIPPTT